MSVNHPNHGSHAQPSLIADGVKAKKVIILAMGSSRTDFDAMQLIEQRPELLQDAELWGINYMGAVKRLHRIIHVDPVHRYLGHAPVKDMCDFALKDGIPLYTSWPHPFYSNHVLYPFDKVYQSLGTHYFNNSVAYALALAMTEGFTDIGLFGADFSYPNAHMSESGRGNCEFLIGIGTQRGIRFAIAQSSTLLDLYCQQQPYGFFADPNLPPNNGGKLMTVQEIMMHCQKVREGTKIIRPQIHAYGIAPQLPPIVAGIAPQVPEHLSQPGWMQAELAAKTTQNAPLADGSMSQEQADAVVRQAAATPPIAGVPHEASIV